MILLLVGIMLLLLAIDIWHAASRHQRHDEFRHVIGARPWWGRR